MDLRIGGLILAFLSISQGLTPSNYLNLADKARLKTLFAGVQPYTELPATHYSILGLTLLGESVPKVQDACNFLKTKVSSVKTVDGIYHAATASKLLGNCQVSSAVIIQTLESSIKDDATVQDLYYSVLALKALGKPVDSTKVSKALLAALKKDDSILNLGYAFHVASQLQGDTTPFVERIEDAVVQADEVDSQFLQFEGGLSITATILSGVFRLAEVAKKPPTMTGEQTVKFTNYLLSRKFVQGVKGASQLLDVLQILSKNKFHVPACVTLASKSALSTSYPIVQVRVTNVLGDPLTPSTLTADTCTRLDDGVTIFSKKAFAPVTGDSTLFSLNFMETKPLRGFYKLLVSVSGSKPEQKLVGHTGAEIQVKVMTDVGVENVELGIVDLDQSVSAKTSKIEFGKKLSTVGEADYHQKVLLRFLLRDKQSGGVLQAHQAFVQLAHLTLKQEIVFVAEQDAQGLYKFDLDLHSKAKEFNYQSGKYSLSLIIGDSVIANPFIWHMGDLMLTFPQNPAPAKEKENPYLAKPVIKHLFREQEKQPTQVVSQAFSVLVVAPMLLLFILWAKIGVNISNFPLSLSAIGFHVGLAGILGLLGLFWYQLNMFTTLKYLSGLTLFTFFAGHGLLSYMAKKQST